MEKYEYVDKYEYRDEIKEMNIDQLMETKRTLKM